MPSRRTNERRGSKTVRIKTTRAEKKGFTVALAATASREKLLAVIVFKERNGILGERVRWKLTIASGEKLSAVITFKERNGILGEQVRWKLTIPANVKVRATKNRWMTAAEYHHWLKTTYGREDHKRLLIVDEYRPHRSDESRGIVTRSCNSELVIVPGGCTSIAQPMDKSVNKPFKT